MRFWRDPDNRSVLVGIAAVLLVHLFLFAFAPYLLRTDGSPGYVTYDDQYSTYYRVWYSEYQRGLGGAFMWALDEDYNGHTQPLLDSMYQATMGLAYTGPTPR